MNNNNKITNVTNTQQAKQWTQISYEVMAHKLTHQQSKLGEVGSVQ